MRSKHSTSQHASVCCIVDLVVGLLPSIVRVAGGGEGRNKNGHKGSRVGGGRHRGWLLRQEQRQQLGSL